MMELNGRNVLDRCRKLDELESVLETCISTQNVLEREFCLERATHLIEELEISKESLYILFSYCKKQIKLLQAKA